jgi:hypothetical protein
LSVYTIFRNLKLLTLKCDFCENIAKDLGNRQTTSKILPNSKSINKGGARGGICSVPSE